MIEPISKLKTVFSNVEIQEVLTDPFSIDAKSIAVIFPKEFKHKQLFKDNLEHVVQDVKELVKERHQLAAEQELLKRLTFDADRDHQGKVCDDHLKKIMDIQNRMNQEIAPYYWVVSEDIDDNMYGYHIKCDYMIRLLGGRE